MSESGMECVLKWDDRRGGGIIEYLEVGGRALGKSSLCKVGGASASVRNAWWVGRGTSCR